jgi:hypothetical protein
MVMLVARKRFPGDVETLAVIVGSSRSLAAFAVVVVLVIVQTDAEDALADPLWVRRASMAGLRLRA